MASSLAWHSDLLKRKLTGGRSHPYRGRRKFEKGRPPAEPTVGEDYRVVARVRGGNRKIRIFATSSVQVSDPKSGKTQTTKIRKVLRNPANLDYSRRGIITKGALVDTELGIVRITSRPGQHGILNAILAEAKT